MSIADKVMAARQFTRTFAGPCLWLAGFASLAGFGGGCWFMRHWDRGDIAEARTMAALGQKNLADLRADMATQRADVIKQAAAERAAGQATVALWLGQIRADYLQIPAKVAAILTPQFEQQFRSQNHAANLDCLDLPLPAATLRMLGRPGEAGGSTTGDRPHSGAGESAP